jgi:hypothetical protein
MAYFNKYWPTEVSVDASPVGLSAVLMQVNPKEPKDKRMVCCVSRLLSEVERRYSQCEKEALAAVWGCERLEFYLFGKEFTLVTDNRAIQLIFGNTSTRPPARIERMALRMSKFNFVIKHCPGKANIADYYSRHPVAKQNVRDFLGELEAEQYINSIVANATPYAISMPSIIEATKEDNELVNLAKYILLGDSNLPSDLLPYRNVFDELNISEDGLIHRGQIIMAQL